MIAAIFELIGLVASIVADVSFRIFDAILQTFRVEESNAPQTGNKGEDHRSEPALPTSEATGPHSPPAKRSTAVSPKIPKFAMTIGLLLASVGIVILLRWILG